MLFRGSKIIFISKEAFQLTAMHYRVLLSRIGMDINVKLIPLPTNVLNKEIDEMEMLCDMIKKLRNVENIDVRLVETIILDIVHNALNHPSFTKELKLLAALENINEN